MKKVRISVMSIVVMLGALLASACAPAVPKDQVEKEIVSFMLDYILREQMGGAGNYTQSGGGRWAEAPEDANIIIWAPPVEPRENSGIEFVKSDQPNRVWWYADQRLVEVTDKQEAVRQFREAHFSSISPTGRAWGYYEFGILSTSSDNREARVYLGVSCGPLCGTGTIYTLQRSKAGSWEIKDSEMKWIS